MPEIHIPFQEMWREKMLTGRKTATTRTKRYGQPGDTFRAFGAVYELVVVLRMPLIDVSLYYLKEEGVESSTQYWRIWEELHPRKGWVPEQMVFYHQFRSA